MINEFGELINDEEIEELIVRLRKLSPEQIDNLWFKCGWIDSERGPSNKALPTKNISHIKRSATLAKGYIQDLFLETPKQEIIRNLSKIENSSKL